MIKKNKPIFSEPKCLLTGVEGAGKTLFAIQQADLLTSAEGGELYQINIRGADPGHLPKLPFDIRAMAFNDDGSPLIDPETGDHLPKWATLPPGSVIIIDEAHKVYPQRGPGRPPKDIEMLAEGRQHGIRFIYMTQSQDSLDMFLRQRISRHFHLERKGNMERATVFEFDHCVRDPRTAWIERKQAVTHFWKYPKQYFGWYTSAKSHHFKLRIPLKMWAAIAFVPVLGYVGWELYHNMSGMLNGTMQQTVPAAAAKQGEGGLVTSLGDGSEGRRPVITDERIYSKQFQEVVPGMPWSAPAYQQRPVVAEPELFCVSSAGGLDGQGEYKDAGCSCITEQGTRYPTKRKDCEAIVAAGGLYNPFRKPVQAVPATAESAKPESLSNQALGVRSASHSVVTASSVRPQYGDVGLPAGESAPVGDFSM